MKENMQGGLLELLKLKKEYLEEMLICAKKSARMLANEDTDAFDIEMQRCEELMRKVDELGQREKELAAKGHDKDILQIKGEIGRVIEQIAKASDECSAVTEEKMKALGSQIKTVRQTKKGMGAYNQQSRDAFFIDAKK